MSENKQPVNTPVPSSARPPQPTTNAPGSDSQKSQSPGSTRVQK